MKKRLLPLSVALLLAYPGLGLADGNHESSGESGHSPETQIINPEAEHSHQHEGNSDANPKTDSHTSESPTHANADEQETPVSGSEGGEHSHGEPVVETPPNYQILGAFGTVNAGLLLIGLWNKWLRRKVA
ncbi:MAG: hypothetical protein ACE3JP_04580 [Ectobacillus sp.]